jgi:hypothetical protein
MRISTSAHAVTLATRSHAISFAWRDESPPRWDNDLLFVIIEHLSTQHAPLVPTLFHHLLVFYDWYGCAGEDAEANLVRHPAVANEAANTFKKSRMLEKIAPDLHYKLIGREFECHQLPPLRIDLEPTRCNGVRPGEPSG